MVVKFGEQQEYLVVIRGDGKNVIEIRRIEHERVVPYSQLQFTCIGRDNPRSMAMVDVQTVGEDSVIFNFEH